MMAVDLVLEHDWDSITDKMGRFWQCSSKNHMKSACPTLKDGRQPRLPVGGSDREEKGKGKGKKGLRKGDGLKESSDNKGEEDKPSLKAQSSSSTMATSQQQSVVPTGDGTEMKTSGSSSGAAGMGGPTTANQEGLVSEVTNLLRSLRVTPDEPRMKACLLRKVAPDKEQSTLLDGGATHCLRRAKSQEEWNNGKQVTVQLASGEVTMKQCCETGTLLVLESIQPIIPVAKLMDLGYSLRWSREECRIENMKYGKIPVVMSQGCPVVDSKWGEILMNEVEEGERKKARVRSILCRGSCPQDQWEQQIAALKVKFPEAPMRALERIPGEKDVDETQLPLNRRRRRQIEQAKNIIIHMFAGGDAGRWKRLESATTVVIAVDTLLGLNVMDPMVAGWIDKLIETGTAGPPCRSVSLCRYGREDGGPRQLRMRAGEERYGKVGLTASEMDLTDHDSAAWLKNLRWMEKVKHHNARAELLLEQPADPEEWCAKGKGCPSFTTWPETIEAINHLQLHEVRCDQGAIGHSARKPTVLYTDMKEVMALQGLKQQEGEGLEWPLQLDQRLKMSKSLACWAPGLVELIIKAGERLEKENIAVKALTQKEKQEVAMWEEHFRMNHIPYRKDCIQCLEAMGRDRPRRRVQSPESYCMSLDLTGPFQEGQDQETNGCKYLMVAAVTIPIEEGQPLPEGLRNMNFKKKIATAHEGDQAEIEGPVEEEGEAIHFEEEEESVEELTEVEVQEVEVANKKWKEFLKETKEIEVKTITWGVPLRSRATKDIMEAVGKIHGRFRALQIPIIRLHCDRAREFVGRTLRTWATNQGMMVTYSAGDEAAGNARVEREIGWLILGTAKAPLNFWPLAARQALEERCRGQLNDMGIPTPALLPFGAIGVARKKTWFNRSQPWKWPRQRVRCWGPASDMSLSSRGQFLQTDDGHFIRSTVVTIPSQWSQKVEEASGSQLEPLEEMPQEGGANTDHALGTAEEAPQDVKGDCDQPLKRQQQVQEGSETGTLAHGCWEPIKTTEEVMILQEPEPRDFLQVLPPSKRRLMTKTSPEHCHPPQPHQQLFVCKATKRGEWTSEDEDEVEEDQDENEELIKLCMFQHGNLQRMIQEEVSNIQALVDGGAGTSTSTLQQAVVEVKELENILAQHEAKQKAMIKSLTAKIEEEVLQTRVVPLEEVRQDMEQWIPAFEKECKALTDGPVKPLTPAEVQRMRDNGEEIEVLPMLAIATRKPPNRYKGRVVVCGNYAEAKPEGSISVGGICSTAIRAVVHLSTERQWSIGTLDVTGAFLQAPRRPHGKTTLAQPPSILQHMQLVQPGELWRVDCALYGLQESPSDWAAHRDEGARNMRWTHQGSQRHLEETAEKHLWKIKNSNNDTCGYMLVYVDDFLIAADPGEMKSLMAKIKQTWVCSEEEMVSKSSTTRFCGYEIQEREGGGFWLGQVGYLNDVLSRRQVEGQENHPCPRIEEGEDEPPCARATKDAQMMVGEALWLANRTRPDILFATGVISRLLHRRPKYACSLGRHLLRFLSGAKHQVLEYKPWGEVKKEPDDHLPHERGWNTLEVYSDVSYGPPHEQYRSVQGVLVEHCGCPIMWESTRQGFVVQSTAEAELLGYSEAYTAGESVASLMEVLEITTQRHLLGDNKAALSLCLNENGPWRTRHLRLRIAHLRSILQREEAQWRASRLKGSRLVADGFTKPLIGQAFLAFVKLLHVSRIDREQDVAKVARCSIVEHVSPNTSRRVAVGALLASGLMLMQSDLVGLGSLILVCAVALWKWWETRSSKANEQRPQQDLQKTRERSNQFEGSDGAAHPPQNRPMDMAMTRDLKGPYGSLGVDGTIPRVCAVRGR